jgi:hypothetical protein
LTPWLSCLLVTPPYLAGRFDLIFLDANKDGYLSYYQAILDLHLLLPGGLLLVDNSLMKVWDGVWWMGVLCGWMWLGRGRGGCTADEVTHEGVSC